MYLASSNSLAGGIDNRGRRAICAERRKSSVMGSSQHAHTVSTTKQNVSLLRSKRSAILPKGKSSVSTDGFLNAEENAAQNISRD